MSRSTPLLKARNCKIYNRYKELYDVNFLRHARVLELLSNEFFLEQLTIEKIVLNQKTEKENITL